MNYDIPNHSKKESIRVQYTVVYSPHHNGLAERKNRSLLEMARRMLIDARFENKYWGAAVNTENYLQNLLTTKCRTKTPFGLWHAEKPNV